MSSASAAARLSKPEPGAPARTREFRATDTSGKEWIHKRREDRDGNKVGGMHWSPAGVVTSELLPYGWERLADLPRDRPIVMVEGEATTEALLALGIDAVGTFGTSYHPSPKALAPFAHREVLLWRDADEPGRKHMLDMAHRLREIASSVRWIEPPSDVFAGWDAADADPVTVKRLISQAGAVPRSPTAATGDSGSRKTSATRLVELALDAGAVLFSDQRGHQWLRLPSRELLSFSDGGVSEWLRELAYSSEHRVAAADAITEARGTLAAEARHRGVVEPVYVRVAPVPGGGIAIDLGSPDWSAAVVRSDGWSIEPTPVNFRRPRDARPLPVPERGGDVRALAAVLNLGEGDVGERNLRLVVAFLLTGTTVRVAGRANLSPLGSNCTPST
jgi:hypothetical protein